jgi:hypothetical protein
MRANRSIVLIDGNPAVKTLELPQIFAIIINR